MDCRWIGPAWASKQLVAGTLALDSRSQTPVWERDNFLPGAKLSRIEIARIQMLKPVRSKIFTILNFEF
ncbi:MAG: hypothetical protein AB4352_23135 [Hormoscilla sp.]